jgi:hypothetical protein
MPGDLNGLTQPALALTAPNVADVDGDGLLTMEEVLALKLDAPDPTKRRLAFCYVTQDGGDEGCLQLQQLPTAEQAEVIRSS